MSHNYHAQNGLSDEVVGDFSDDEDEILADNNNNDNNDIQFLFQQTSTENFYRPYPNSADVGDNQVPDNPDYRHFLDHQQQSDSRWQVVCWPTILSIGGLETHGKNVAH